MIKIHGKDYVTVSERVAEAHKELEKLTITTEVLYQTPVVIKATVTINKGVFTGISAANPSKVIEKQSPYEVAETSAVGRALGFAGYGIVEGIATADEVVKADKELVTDDYKDYLPKSEWPDEEQVEKPKGICNAHDEPVKMFHGVSKSKVDKEGNPKEYWYHIGEKGKICFGQGWQA